MTNAVQCVKSGHAEANRSGLTVFIAQKSSLTSRADVAYVALDQGHLDKATRMIIPPPYHCVTRY